MVEEHTPEPMISVDGQPRPVDETHLMETAVAQVNQLTAGVTRLARARRRDRIAWTLMTVLLGFVCYFGVRLYDLVQEVHHAAVVNCVIGNDYKHGDELGWQKFVALAVAGAKDKQAAQAFARPFLAYIHSLDVPHNCTKLYSPWFGLLP